MNLDIVPLFTKFPTPEAIDTIERKYNPPEHTQPVWIVHIILRSTASDKDKWRQLLWVHLFRQSWTISSWKTSKERPYSLHRRNPPCGWDISTTVSSSATRRRTSAKTSSNAWAISAKIYNLPWITLPWRSRTENGGHTVCRKQTQQPISTRQLTSGCHEYVVQRSLSLTDSGRRACELPTLKQILKQAFSQSSSTQEERRTKRPTQRSSYT